MDNLRLLVQEEGRAARNLVAFHVDLAPADSGKITKKPPTSPRLLVTNDGTRVTKRSSTPIKSGSRVRSASTGRDKKSELQARYWAFLFGNLQRAVDEIYQTCEMDESVSECKEVILVLENFTRDFHNLIEWFKLKWEYENTPPPQRPTSLAWEVRKSSPGKVPCSSLSKVPDAATVVKRQLNFTEDKIKGEINESNDPVPASSLGLSFGDVNLEKHLKESKSDNSEVLKEISASKSEIEVSFDEQVPEVLKLDQSSQTDPEKNESAVKTANNPKVLPGKKLMTNTGPIKVASSNKQITTPSSPQPGKNVTANSFVPNRKSTPQSPTSLHKSLSYGTGRNVAAATFVPTKKAILSNATSGKPLQSSISFEKNCKGSIATDVPCKSKATGSISNVNKSCNNLMKSGTKEIQNENVQEGTDYTTAITDEKKGSESEGAAIIDEEEKQPENDENKTSSTDNMSENKKIERKDIDSKNDVLMMESNSDKQILNSESTSSKTLCGFVDKGVMTDMPAIIPAKQKTNVCEGSKQLSDKKLFKSSPSLTANKTKSLAGESSDTLKKLRSTNEIASTKPAYSTVSKLVRSHTSADMRSSSSKMRAYSLHNKKETSGPVPAPKQNRVHSAPVGGREKASAKMCFPFDEQKRSGIKDEDGWETVRAKSRWRANPLSQSSGNIKTSARGENGFIASNAASRFHLPSPATSLPALALALESTSSEKTVIKQRKDKRNAEIKSNKSSYAVDRKSYPGSASSDKISTNKFKNEESSSYKGLPSNLRKELRELFVTKMDVQRLYEEDLRKSRELFEEELLLTKEIRDLEVDTETDGTETDGELTETAGTEEDENNEKTVKALQELSGLSWADQMETLEKLEALMAQDSSSKGINWSDRLSTLEQLEELVARHPGRAIELHQKLSSPSRRRTLPEAIRRHHARQASAHQKREQLLLDKTAKLRELLSKVGEVKAAQSQLAEERRIRLEQKLKRAEEKRNLHLSSIRRKAHDEEEKLREIAFINELEAQNKRHDFMALCQEQEERLQGILEERQRRQEEKAAKEAAVEERRRILEAERQEKLEKMQERRRKREERIGREQQEKEKERLEMAREKARDREERLQALQAAQLANVEELQKKIQQKQEDSARRHEENIEQIRQRALETAALRTAADTNDEAPRLAPYDTKKLCLACNVLIESEVYLLSHLRGRPHQEALKTRTDIPDIVIVDAPPGKLDPKVTQDKERQKALKKRCKKIRTRMMQRGEEYVTKLSQNANKKLESPNRGRILKCLKDVERLHANQGQGQWPNNAITQLERSLSEINRILEKKNSADQMVFRELNGFTNLNNILNLGLDVAKNMSPYIPPKCFVTTCTAYSLACQDNTDNARFVILTNKIILVLDLLHKQLDSLIPESWRGTKLSTSLPVDCVAGALMRMLAAVLDSASKNSSLPDDLTLPMQDILSYSVSIGIVDRLAAYCSRVRDPLDGEPQIASFLLSAIQLLTSFAHARCGNRDSTDPTQLVATLKATELMGGVSMLYGILLHQGSPPREADATPPPLPNHTLDIAVTTIRLLNAVASMHLNMFQAVLGSEGLSLQFRHIASYLLWYCAGRNEQLLLHELLPLIGFFAVKHQDNQLMLQSGGMPTVLQQLCNLPFGYFSKPELSQILFPTLLACCKDNPCNKLILEQELTYQMLEDFLMSTNETDTEKNLLIKLIKM